MTSVCEIRDEDPGIGADERRREQRDYNADFDDAPSVYTVQRHKIGESRSDDAGEKGHAGRDREAVDHRLIIIFPLEEMSEICHAPGAGGRILKRAEKQGKERVNEKERKDRDGEKSDTAPKIPAESCFIDCAPHLPSDYGCHQPRRH